MSRLGDRNQRHDAFHQKAKKEGFAARAVYKLQEIDEKHHLFRPGQSVLDLGCRPGSWLQYARRKVGERPLLVGIDREPLAITIPNSEIVIGDIFKVTPGDLAFGLAGFEVVLSDMAPDTSGIRSLDQARSEALFERALDLCDALLLPGGHFVGKLFQGPDFQRIIKRCRATFTKAVTAKPESSRKDSIEQYVVCLNRRRSETGAP
jgi:23S rRNA (uridine2552-2'-O)-methyltransferase